MKQPDKTPSVFPLRLPTTTRLQANEMASLDGVSLNQFITLAVAEKIARLQLRGDEPSPANLEAASMQNFSALPSAETWP
jgi:hypothetical protein